MILDCKLKRDQQKSFMIWLVEYTKIKSVDDYVIVCTMLILGETGWKTHTIFVPLCQCLKTQKMNSFSKICHFMFPEIIWLYSFPHTLSDTKLCMYKNNFHSTLHTFLTLGFHSSPSPNFLFVLRYSLLILQESFSY